MTTTAELVRDNCDQLPAYVSALFAELLLARHSAADGAPGRPSALAASPPPGDAAAFYALNTIWESVFRIEEWLHDEDAGPWDGYDLAPYPRQRRGYDARSFLAALQSIQKLAAGRDEDVEAAAARILEGLNNLARAHPAIDEAQQWRRIRNHPCRYCGCFYLEVLLDKAMQATTHIECHAAAAVGCHDGNGRRPAATLTIDGIQWADGHTENVRRLEAA